MKLSPPDGTRYTFAQDAARRLETVETLRRLYEGWGYAPVEPPALEHYDPAHPAADKSFKLSDRDSGVLALRADFTPALARLVRLYYPEAAGEGSTPRRFHYRGTLWQAIDPDLARTREFTQVGLELVGVSNPKADAELIHLARESVRAVGLTPRVEVGNPGFVRALFDLAEVPENIREPLADAVDRKDVSTLRGLLEPLSLPPDLRRAFLTLPDLYGDVYGEAGVIEAARAVAPWAEARLELDRLEAILSEFEDDSELLLDLGMARRHRYYTGMVFRAYTFDFGQPLLGGGRYDGALLPYAAGFALGLERLMSALSPAGGVSPPLALSLDDTLARRLRAAGYVVERALEADVEKARQYARARGVPYLLTKGGLEPLTPHPPHVETLRGLLEGVA